MMAIEVGTQKTALGRAEVVNVGRCSNGESRYEVVFVGGHKERLGFELRHRRTDGPWRLSEKVCRRVRKEMDKFYSFPAEKVVDGLVRAGDVPERYAKDFGKWLGVATVSMMPRRPCPEGCVDVDLDKKGETGINVSDLLGFLESRRYGRIVAWD